MVTVHRRVNRMFGSLAVIGLVALLLLIMATAALGGVWLPGQEPSEPVAAPHEMDQMYRPSVRTLPADPYPFPKPKPRSIVQRHVVPPPSGDVWGRLRNCESSDGRSSSNGLYHNWFQFDVQTWHSVGGQGHPKDASYDEALKRAKMLQASRGWSPWPSCSRQLGLRR